MTAETAAGVRTRMVAGYVRRHRPATSSGARRYSLMTWGYDR